MLALDVALGHLTNRKRQTFVSLSGVVLGVAFFLAVSSLMRGSEKDFIKRLVDNSPHITVSDEYRLPRVQPAALRWSDGAIRISNVKPQTETRGIRGYRQKLEFVESLPGLRVAPVLVGSAVLTFAGRQEGVTLSGIVPATIKGVSTIDEKIIDGSLDALAANPNGIVIGKGLADKFNLERGQHARASPSPNGPVPADEGGGHLPHRQRRLSTRRRPSCCSSARRCMLDRPNRVNRFIIQLDDAYAARDVARAHRGHDRLQVGVLGGSLRGHPERALIRNIIMYSVVSAILIVASFGIYNTLSTIVMEKTRDIAIMKSMGFHARDVRSDLPARRAHRRRDRQRVRHRPRRGR